MQLDLKKIPFGRRLSRHLVYEETDAAGAGWNKGLYLALAAEGGGSFIGGPMSGPKGFARITPTSGGKTLDYTYMASPFAMEMNTAKGGVRFALDGAKVLRIEGQGVGLRLDGRLEFGSIAITTARGIELTMAGGVYLITARRGSLSLDCHWELKALRSSDPIITIEPDETGALDLVIYDTDDAYGLPELAGSLDDSAAASERDYTVFLQGIAEIGPENDALFRDAAYALWTGFITFKGMELAPAGKMSDQKIYALDQFVLALAFKDAVRALDLIGGMLSFASPQGLVPAWVSDRQNLYEAVPPLYALVVSRLIDDGRIKGVPKANLAEFYDAMSKAVGWWLERRKNDAGLCYYAYRHECGRQKEPIFGCGTPAATPDLAAHIALAAFALAKLAGMLGRMEDAASWEETGNCQVDLLTGTLWDGAQFLCINALTGEKAPAEGVLSLTPLILGRWLPANISFALAEKAAAFPWETAPVTPTAVILLSLQATGRDEDAKTGAQALVNACAATGATEERGKTVCTGEFYTPAVCAALLALAGALQ